MDSLLQLLGKFGAILQDRLFPALEQELTEFGAEHQLLVAIFGLVGLDGVVGARHRRGRPPYDRVKIARAFIAKAVLQLPHTRALLSRLACDKTLRRLCGWETAKAVPPESVFSRAFAGFASSNLAQRAHQLLVERTHGKRLVGHITRDSSAIEVREAPRKEQTQEPRRKSRPNRSGKPKAWDKMTRVERQCSGKMTLEQMVAELPCSCNAGCKNNSRGNKSVWVGYKLHLDVADGQIPISGVLTSASLHDSQAAVPLALMTARRVTSLYDLMDSAYDSHSLRQYSRSLGHVPIIEPQKRGAHFVPLSPHERMRFRERTSVERVFSRLKDEFGGRFVRVRGAAKVLQHLMFGIVALTADQLLRLGGGLGAIASAPS